MVIKYIRTATPYERYQVDLIEILVELNMKNKFPYLLICTGYFDN